MRHTCLSCQFLCFYSNLSNNGKSKSISAENRTIDNCLSFIQNQPRHIDYVFCYCGAWEFKRVDTHTKENIQTCLTRKDRGVKCVFFCLYDRNATPEYAKERLPILREIIDRKKTRAMAFAALLISTLSLMFTTGKAVLRLILYVIQQISL